MSFTPHVFETAAPPVSRAGYWRKTIGEWLAMLGGLLYWGIFGLGLTLVSIVLLLILPPVVGRRIGQRLIHLLFRVFVCYLKITNLVRVDLSDLKSLRKKSEPFIVAPNHTSLWDAVFIFACLPHAVCVMKESILKNPVLGGGARLAGYIPNDSIKKMIRAATAALAEGSQLLLFPEGTRTDADQRWINPLKGGCGIIATRTGCPVQVLFIRSDTRFLQKGWPLWKRPAFPLQLSFEVGPELRPHSGESPQDFTRRLQAVYEQELSRPHPLRRQLVTGHEA
ncbi:MAG: lysophospholipid acyltransferase family protein [Luteolibacter sp.]